MKPRHFSIWWGPPKNFDDRKSERKISWLELFYDLVYVAAISQLTHQLSEHPTWTTLGYTFLLFCLIFWSWVNGSQYYDLHGSDGIRTRLLTFWQMLAIAAVAITVNDAFSGHFKPFAIAVAMLQIIITYLWWSVGYYDPSHRVFNKFYSINYIAALILLLFSIFGSYAMTTPLWIAVLILNLSPPFTGARTITRILKERGQVFTASTAIVERFGLFTIIVLAESILGIVSGMAEVHDKSVGAWFAFILAVFISFLLWSIYFDMTSEQETKTGYSYMQWLIFLHFPLLFALGMLGACMKVLLSDMRADLHPNVQWMFCIAIATILLMIAGLTKIMKEEEEDRSYIKPVSRLILAILIIVLMVPLFGQYLDTLAFLGCLAFLLCVPVIVGIGSWVRYRISSVSSSNDPS